MATQHPPTPYHTSPHLTSHMASLAPHFPLSNTEECAATIPFDDVPAPSTTMPKRKRKASLCSTVRWWQRPGVSLCSLGRKDNLASKGAEAHALTSTAMCSNQPHSSPVTCECAPRWSLVLAPSLFTYHHRQPPFCILGFKQQAPSSNCQLQAPSAKSRGPG